MDLADLRIFKAVAEEGGILRAARKLHRVQSSVTTRIKQLEASVGAQLFFRARQRLVLSPSGESLLVYADKLLRLAEEARLSVSGQRPSGTLRIGALESTSASRLPGVLARFHRSFPNVRVELQTGTNDALTAAVKDRRLDAAFVAEAPSDGTLAALPLFREKLVLISALGHRPVSGPRDVDGASIIAFPNGCAYRRVLERWLGARRLAMIRVLELSSYHAIVACVGSGTGVAVLPESVLDAVNSEAVARYPLPEVLAEIVTPLIWRAAETSPSIIALREVLGVEVGVLRPARASNSRSDESSPSTLVKRAPAHLDG